MDNTIKRTLFQANNHIAHLEAKINRLNKPVNGNKTDVNMALASMRAKMRLANEEKLDLEFENHKLRNRIQVLENLIVEMSESSIKETE